MIPYYDSHIRLHKDPCQCHILIYSGLFKKPVLTVARVSALVVILKPFLASILPISQSVMGMKSRVGFLMADWPKPNGWEYLSFHWNGT